MAPEVLTDLAVDLSSLAFRWGFGWHWCSRDGWCWGFAVVLPFAGIVYWAFLHDWWLNFIMPALFTLISNVGLVALYRVLVEEHEKRKVRGAFQQYVSPEVMRRLLQQSRAVKPRKTDITVLFSDIRGFTTISEIARRARTRANCSTPISHRA